VVGGRAHKPSEKLGPTVDGGPRKKRRSKVRFPFSFGWLVGKKRLWVGAANSSSDACVLAVNFVRVARNRRMDLIPPDLAAAPQRPVRQHRERSVYTVQPCRRSGRIGFLIHSFFTRKKRRYQQCIVSERGALQKVTNASVGTVLSVLMWTYSTQEMPLYNCRSPDVPSFLCQV
jgi:hypothetical protein